MTLFKKLFALCCLLLAATLPAQIKVFSGGGNVSIGSTGLPVTNCKLQVVGGNTIFMSTNTIPTSSPLIFSTNSYSTASAPDYSWYGDAQTGIFHPTGNHIIGFTISGAEKMRIHSNGFVGIEATAPASTLSIGGNGNSAYKGYFYNSSTANGTTAGYFTVATPTGSNRSYATQGIVTCATGYAYGVYGSSYNATAQTTGQAYGVYGVAGNATTGYNYGVAGILMGSRDGAGIYGSDRTTAGTIFIGGNYAGFFSGMIRTTYDFPEKPTSGSWTGYSDARLKKDVAAFKDGLDVLRRIKPVTYQFNGKGGLPTGKTYIGVIAQDVQQVAPYCVGSSHLVVKESDAGQFETAEPAGVDSAGEAMSKVPVFTYNYDALIYVLINSVKQLDSTIASIKEKDAAADQPVTTGRGQQLQQQLDDLKEQVNACCQNKNATEIRKSTENSAAATESSWLAQNKPNPFNVQTVIDYNVVQQGKASILVFDMSGKLLKTIPVKIPGRGSVTIHANDFQAGMYYYSLVVNDEEVDTKRMILTE